MLDPDDRRLVASAVSGQVCMGLSPSYVNILYMGPRRTQAVAKGSTSYD